MKKITLRENPLLEISLDSSYIHIIDFKKEKNNTVFYLEDLTKIEISKKFLLFESSEKKIKINLSNLKISLLEDFVGEIRGLKSSKSLLYPKEVYKLETFEEFQERYRGYGKELYGKLKKIKPEVFNKLKFYQKLDDKEDSIAEYIDDKVRFIIYLDFYSDKIEISNYEKTNVVGFWEKNEIKKSINFILNDLIKE